MSIEDFLKKYGFLIIPIVTAIISISGVWATFGIRISEIEARQDRQGTTITTLQTQVTGLANDISGIKATLGAINDNVNYIRNRIDKVTQ